MDPQQVTELRNSIRDCSDRGLSVASKWYVPYRQSKHWFRCSWIVRSSELLLSVSLSRRNSSAAKSTFSTSTPARSHSPQPSLSFVNPLPTTPGAPPAVPVTPARNPHAPQAHVEPDDIRTQELQWEAEDADVLATARACIDAREYLRAVYLLRERKSAKARFLSLYSQFLVCRSIRIISSFPLTIRYSRLAKRRLSEIGINLIVSPSLRSHININPEGLQTNVISLLYPSIRLFLICLSKLKTQPIRGCSFCTSSTHAWC